jgi:DNA-binding response OmpR family regulator
MPDEHGLVRILIIDDDWETTELFKILLEPKQFEVITANSGQYGIKLAGQTDPDVIMVDLLMSEMNGLKVCDEIRKFSSVPILVLTAISKPGTLSETLKHGADDYLIKPVNSSVLTAHLKRLVRRERLNRQVDRYR